MNLQNKVHKQKKKKKRENKKIEMASVSFLPKRYRNQMVKKYEGKKKFPLANQTE
jgi:hypothetical protein